jgi:pimeloyl-ACP methyl ester carboxylesterase
MELPFAGCISCVWDCLMVGGGEFLHERLPNSRVVLIDAGHFVWEKAPAEYASTILDSIPGNRS